MRKARPDNVWVRALALDLFARLGAHGLKESEEALAAIVGTLLRHGTPNPLAGASVPAVDPSRSIPNAHHNED